MATLTSGKPMPSDNATAKKGALWRWRTANGVSLRALARYLGVDHTTMARLQALESPKRVYLLAIANWPEEPPEIP